MPRDKDLKRLVRTRMEKTGEAYTSARANITRKATRKDPSIDYPALAGKSDETIKQKTGRTWAEWTRALDGDNASNMTHAERAQLVHEKYEVGDWWGQTVAVGYERIKGLRAIGQRMDGSYEASKSRTFNVPVDVLFDAWSDAKIRRKWLPEKVKVRTANPPKTMRLDWSDGTIIPIGFLAKGKSKSSVAVQHSKLPDRASVARMKAFWTERLDALATLLEK